MKIAIKRAQSQTCLSFAEREQFATQGKIAIKRAQSQTCLSFAEREQFATQGKIAIKRAQSPSLLEVLLVMICMVISAVPGMAYASPTDKTTTAGLKGKVISAISREPIPGVSIYFPGLKIGTTTNSDGLYSIDNLPKAILLVQVSSVGYRTFTGQVDMSVTLSYDFELKESITEISAVVITGQPDFVEKRRIPAPIYVIPRAQLLQGHSTNIIDAIAHVPGISQITTGVGISKPVIRGLSYNRVIVMNNGVRQEGQQWGDEHGIEIDEYDVDHVEILKGPASLVYGSDAMAGVVNMLNAPTLPNGAIKANIISNFQTNNGLIGYSANFSGNKNGFIWDSRFSGKLAHAYENKYDGPVYNSGFRETAASALLGLNRSWGFSHLHLSLYNLKPGMVEGERDEETGQFLKTVTLPGGEQGTEIATSSDFNSYSPDAPFQKIAHYKAVLNNNIFLGKGNLQATFGFQQNSRKEFEDPERYGLFFLMNTFTYNVKYVFPEKRGWKFTSGLNGMGQKSKNKGTEFLVPAYKLFDVGAFAIAHKKFGKFDFAGGLRYDRREQKAEALYLDENEEVVPPSTPGATERFSSFDKTFHGISGSFGATYQISELLHTRVNISRGFRAPNIAELGSNGEHEGTFRYEIGNQNLDPETSLQFDWGIGFDTDHVSAELTLFNNAVDHYIYSHKLSSVAGTDSLIEDLSVFKFTQGKARLYGGEVYVDIHPHPLDWLHFENTFSLVRGTLRNRPDVSRNLPMIPSPRWVSEIRANFAKVNGFMENTYIKFGIDQNWEQDRFYEAFGTETGTPGYTLLNIGAGTDIVRKRNVVCSLYMSVNNLSDKAYQNHLSRLKYAGFNYATERPGVFNMGRNFSFTVLIPIVK